MILDQGIVGFGQDITLYGVSISDTITNTVRAVSISGGYNNGAIIENGKRMTIALVARTFASGLQAQDIHHPHLNLWPGSEGRELTTFVHGVDQNSVLSALLVPEASLLGETVSLGFSSSSSSFEGRVSFANDIAGLGRTHVRGITPNGRTVALDVDFNIASVDVVKAQDIFSPDGIVELHMVPDSFTASNVYMVVMPTGVIPQPVPTGMSPVSNAYSIRSSGAVVELARPALLVMHYDTAQTEPTQIKMARWRERGWQLLESEMDTEHFSVSASITHLGIYGLFSTAAEAMPDTFLPYVSNGGAQ